MLGRSDVRIRQVEEGASGLGPRGFSPVHVGRVFESTLEGVIVQDRIRGVGELLGIAEIDQKPTTFAEGFDCV
jgi:hypothetical protein